MAMRAQSIHELMTADELGYLDVPGKSTELIRGRLLVREPPGSRQAAPHSSPPR